MQLKPETTKYADMNLFWGAFLYLPSILNMRPGLGDNAPVSAQGVRVCDALKKSFTQTTKPNANFVVVHLNLLFVNFR
jgi:hypothetical protein